MKEDKKTKNIFNKIKNFRLHSNKNEEKYQIKEMESVLNEVLKEKEKIEKESLSKIKKLEELLEKKELERINLENKLIDKENLLEYNDFTMDIKAYQNINEITKSQLQVCILKVEEYKKKNDYLNQNNIKLQEQLKATEKIKDLIESKIKENSCLAEKWENEYTKIKEESSKTLKEKEVYESENKALNLVVKQLKKENDELKAQIASLKSQMENNKSKQEITFINNEEEMNAFLDIINTFLLRIYLFQYSVCIFDLLPIIAINKEKFELFNSNKNNVYQVKEISYLLYNDIKAYILSNQPNEISFADYLDKRQIGMNNDQKIFIESIKKVKLFQKQGNILESFKLKRDNHIKVAEINFNMIKAFIEEKNPNSVNNNTLNNFFNVNNATLRLNFEQLYQNNQNIPLSLYSYYIKKSFPLAENISITLSTKNTLHEAYILSNSLCLYCPNIKSLSIKGNVNFINPYLYIPLIENLGLILNASNKLTHLHLENFDFSIYDTMFTNALNEIKNLKLEKLELINSLPPSFISSLSSYLINNQLLKVLNFSHHDNMQIPLKVFSSLSYSFITSLSLSDNLLTDKDCQFLSSFIEDSPHLTFLDISYNAISNTGSTYLGNGFCKTNSLSNIIMNNCNLNDERFMLILNRSVHSFSHIVVDNNPIRDTGIIGICEFIKFAKKLKLFSVKNCDLSTMGVSVFLNNVANSPLIELEICFENNKQINDDIKEILEKNKVKFIRDKYVIKFSEINFKSSVLKNMKEFTFIKIINK